MIPEISVSAFLNDAMKTASNILEISEDKPSYIKSVNLLITHCRDINVSEAGLKAEIVKRVHALEREMPVIKRTRTDVILLTQFVKKWRGLK
jgi:hypothetical protein